MLEIEQKFRCRDRSVVVAKVTAWGATGPEVHHEADHYFNAPDRDFARTDEAFRLRRIGTRNFLTYKGPKQRAAVKIRTELEIPILDGCEAAEFHIRLLQHLGYRPVAVVTKHRTSYEFTRDGFEVTVCLDDVEEAGSFVEIEVLADGSRRAEAQALIQALAAEAGLSDVEPRSYLGLVLDNREKAKPRPEPAVVTDVASLRKALAEARRFGHTVGFVPTMGALHDGHAALIRASAAADDFVVVSVFVNPTQFAPTEDLAKYPRTFDADKETCRQAGAHLIFHPTPEVMYPDGFRTFVEVEGLGKILEGEIRPTHFRGVATVVLKLLNLVGPDRAYFGQKDAQQVAVIRRMVKDLSVPAEIVVCETVREKDGLAMSSRNRYLDSGHREQAVALSRALRDAEGRYKAGERDPKALEAAMRAAIAEAADAVLDYAVAVDGETLLPVEKLEGPGLLAVAARFGTTRLIDNVPVGK